VWWASGRIPSAHLGHITNRIYGRATDLGCGCELTLCSTAGRVAGIANGVVFELAGARIATGRVHALAGVAFFSAFHDTIAAHLQRDSLTSRGRVRETGDIQRALG
jgi:hypothetical protein